MSEWQPIETAPKDGRWVLIYGGKSIHDPQDGSRTFECRCDIGVSGFSKKGGAGHAITQRDHVCANFTDTHEWAKP